MGVCEAFIFLFLFRFKIFSSRIGFSLLALSLHATKASSVESLEVSQLKSPALFSTSQKEGKATVSSLKWLLGDEPSITIILLIARWNIPVCTTNLSSLESTNSITIVLLLLSAWFADKTAFERSPLSKYHLLIADVTSRDHLSLYDRCVFFLSLWMLSNVADLNELNCWLWSFLHCKSKIDR